MYSASGFCVLAWCATSPFLLTMISQTSHGSTFCFNYKMTSQYTKKIQGDDLKQTHLIVTTFFPLSLQVVVVIGRVSFRRPHSQHYFKRSNNWRGRRISKASRDRTGIGAMKNKNIAQTTPSKYVRKNVGLVILLLFKITRRGRSPIQGSICVVWTFKEIKVDWFH